MCSFKSQDSIRGTFLVPDDKERIFYMSLDGSDSLLPLGLYTLIIGNDMSMTKAPRETFYKEVRVWKSIRSEFDWRRYMLHKLDPTEQPDLFAYFRLANGQFEQYDLAVPYFNESASTKYLMLEAESSLVVCSSSQYNYFEDGKCYRNPYHYL